MFFSCDKTGDPEVGGTVLQEFSGDWWVVALKPDGVTPAYGGDYVHFTTYNTAANDNTLWLDDNNQFMQIKSKVSVDINKETFNGQTNADEIYTKGKVTVTEGSFSRKSYTTASKTVVDEITFKAEFDWDPGTVYVFKGHRRTGFAEDENPHYSN
ncbi:lipid-binding protein [Tenacibaculum sp. UWU-22]|uniref:lipid-binding protein n=1 Tax=Tenacibaculum sp. UWU-22 TaxID=3234187 RepID=UPI0034DB5279